MSNKERMPDVQRLLLGELNDSEADALVSELVGDQDVTTRIADAAMNLIAGGGLPGAPRVATHTISRIPSMVALPSPTLAMVAAPADNTTAAFPYESFANDGIETLVRIETVDQEQMIVVYVKEESKVPVPNATVSLRIVEPGGRSDRRAKGSTDERGRLELGNARFFGRPDHLSFYQLSVVAPPKRPGSP